MSESERVAEEARLLARTEDLRQRTRALDRRVTPFDAAAHADLARDLIAHMGELRAYRLRFLQPRKGSETRRHT